MAKIEFLAQNNKKGTPAANARTYRFLWFFAQAKACLYVHKRN